MVKLTKKYKEAVSKVEQNKAYDLEKASGLLKDITFTKFDAAVDLDIRLGVDPRKANQMVRGTVALPHGIGKEVRILALATGDKEKEAKEAGADHAGLDEFLQKIEQGWLDFDVIVTTPDVMPKIGRYGKILGPRGLMPNPKSGTVTMDLAKTITEIKAGKIDFKVDRYGIVHATIGRVSFTPDKIFENAKELLQTISRLKPSASKGTYFKSITMSSTMSPGISIDAKSVPGI
ncbi:MAG: 50S ribosomal protein L1 [Bacteroidia bacterium]